MPPVNFSSAIVVAGILFVIGLTGVLVRRNILFILIAIDVMLNACGVAFVAAGSFVNQPDGQVMYFFILSMAGAEVAVGLGLVLQMYHKFGTLDVDSADKLKG